MFCGSPSFIFWISGLGDSRLCDSLVAAFAKYSRKESFTACEVGQESEGVDTAHLSMPNIPLGIDIDLYPLAIECFAHPAYVIFVLLLVECAGAVYEGSAHSQRTPDV